MIGIGSTEANAAPTYRPKSNTWPGSTKPTPVKTSLSGGTSLTSNKPKSNSLLGQIDFTIRVIRYFENGTLHMT